MKRNLIATLLIAASATLAAPAFASGYGPAPFYRPAVGSPTSQQGPSAQAIAAEEHANGTDAQAYGGSRDTQEHVFIPDAECLLADNTLAELSSGTIAPARTSKVCGPYINHKCM